LELFELTTVQAVCADVFEFLKKKPAAVDLVFADPPYALQHLAEIPKLVFAAGVLAAGGELVLEHGEDHRFEGTLGFDQTRKYGGVFFSFFTAPEA
jgi:16S rRNA G966 N2-methylase RsmD